MTILEPQDAFGLWDRVKPLTEWPDTDETAIDGMADGWAGGGKSLGSTIEGMGNAGTRSLATWQSGSGHDYSAKLNETERLRAVAAQMGTIAGHARQFGEIVKNSKQAIVDTINVNGPLFGLMSSFPGAAKEGLQNWFASQVANDINAMLDRNAAQIAGLPTAASEPLPDVPSHEELLARPQYQVPDDEVVEPLGKRLAKAEYEEIMGLGPLGIADVLGNSLIASVEGLNVFPDIGRPGDQDNHRDAFRHSLWNAYLTVDLGAETAARITTKHEGLPDDGPLDQAREAMDLYNNEVGRKIAEAHPDAGIGELSARLQQAIREGKLVVLDENGRLVPSDKDFK